MINTPDSFDALTVPGELNAIPWTENEGKSEFLLPLGLVFDDDVLPFQDTMPLDGELPVSPQIL
jgi:hypothetical protein